MIKLSSKLLTLPFFFLIFLGCDDSAKKNSTLNPEFIKTYNELKQLQKDISDKIILRSSDQRSIDISKSHLVELKNILVYLSDHPHDKVQINRAFEISEKFSSLLLPLPDQSRIYPVLRFFDFVMSRVAIRNNIDVNARNRTLFSYDFGDKLSPFWSESHSHSNKDLTWITTDGNAVNNQTKATARSNKFDINQAWLVSPQFTFLWISNPELQIRHSIQISRGEGNFNTAELLKNGYKVLVSDNYEYGSPLKFCTPGDDACSPAQAKSTGENINWRQLDFDKPKGDDFHAITTRPISLRNYAEKQTVFIAILLDFTNENVKVLGKHFNIWDIFEFKVLGLGFLPKPAELPPPPPPVPALFEANFSEDTLTPFESVRSNPKAFNWKRGEFRQVGHASLESNFTTTTTRLIATDIFLKQEVTNTAVLNFDYTVNVKKLDYDLWQRLQVKVSKNYKKGMPFEDANWQNLDFKPNKPIKDKDKFLNFKSGPLDISNFLGENLSLVFEFNSETSDNHLWQVKNIKITPVMANEGIQ